MGIKAFSLAMIVLLAAGWQFHPLAAQGIPPDVEDEFVPLEGLPDDRALPEEIPAGDGVQYAFDPPPSLGIFSDFPAQVFYSGDWFHRGDWYTRQDAVLLNRGRPRPQAISGVSTGFVDQIGRPIALKFLSTQSARLRTAPGTRITVGRRLGRDMENRDREIEFTFLGLFNWEGQNQLASNAASNQQQVFVVQFATLGGFSGVQFHRMLYEADMNSFEANYRLQHRPGRDRMLLNPDGTWVRESNPGWVPTFLGGIRYLMLDENFQLLARGPDPTTKRGDYLVTTENNLIGLQIGLDLDHHAGWWSVGCRNKVGGYVNFANQRSKVIFVDSENIPPDRDEIARSTPIAFIGELQLYGSIQLVTNVYLRTSWDLQLIHGLAIAPEQIKFENRDTPIINLGGISLNMGLSVGFEMNW